MEASSFLLVLGGRVVRPAHSKRRNEKVELSPLGSRKRYKSCRRPSSSSVIVLIWLDLGGRRRGIVGTARLEG
jgi:hypothetical protein